MSQRSYPKPGLRRGTGRSSVSYLTLHPMGFSVPPRLLLGRWALTPPFHPYQLRLGSFLVAHWTLQPGWRFNFLWHCPWASLAAAPPVCIPARDDRVKRHRARRCSDFPPPACARSDPPPFQNQGHAKIPPGFRSDKPLCCKNLGLAKRVREAIFEIDMDAVVKLDNLRIEYRSGKFGEAPQVALKGLSLEVFPGEVFGFLGPNGAGKTTTMNVLLGFLPPTRGSASIFGVDVCQPIARQRLGFLPEQTAYYRFLSADELLRFYARLFGLTRAETESRLEDILKLVDLTAVRHRLIKTYSKGMQQRVGLAQALINRPDLLILDEPTSGLDPVGRMKVREIIQHLKAEGRTVFFSSHELGEVETICDRVAILAQGELKAAGRIDDLRQQYRQDSLEQIFLEVIGLTRSS